jgi:hypothetical protein
MGVDFVLFRRVAVRTGTVITLETDPNDSKNHTAFESAMLAFIRMHFDPYKCYRHAHDCTGVAVGDANHQVKVLHTDNTACTVAFQCGAGN